MNSLVCGWNSIQSQKINGKVVNKTVYLCIGSNKLGHKKYQECGVGASESSSFWMSVLTRSQARGVEDILITCTDNLNGFTDTIRTVFPVYHSKSAWLHQIRNSCRQMQFVRIEKNFTSDMKNIYNAVNKEMAALELV